MANITFRQFEEMNKSELHSLIIDTSRDGLFLVPYAGKRKVGEFVFSQQMNNKTYNIPRKEFIKKLPSFIEPGPCEEYQLSGSIIIFRKFAYKVGEAKKGKNEGLILKGFNSFLDDSFKELRRVCKLLDIAANKEGIDISPYLIYDNEEFSISIEVGGTYYEFSTETYIYGGEYLSLKGLTEGCEFITDMMRNLKPIIEDRNNRKEKEKEKEVRRRALLESLSREDLELLGLTVPDEEEDEDF